jgi:hypothetical protein
MMVDKSRSQSHVTTKAHNKVVTMLDEVHALHASDRRRMNEANLLYYYNDVSVGYLMIE